MIRPISTRLFMSSLNGISSPPHGRSPRARHSVSVRVAALTLLLLLLAGCASRPVRQQHVRNARYDFALIGDMPYSPFSATNAFPNLARELNRNRLAFVIHDGDIKSGSAPCTDEILEHRLSLFQSIRHPFILVFGDNEWTDCGGDSKKDQPGGPRDPRERLAKLRELFCPENVSLGRHRLRLERQSARPEFAGFPENVRWIYGGVLYVGLNLPGSGNNVADPDEFIPRQRANLAWMTDSFDLARRNNLRAVMLVIQANPKFEDKPDAPARAGFNDFLELLRQETVAFQKPVVLVHGDTHYFRIDKPMMGARGGRRVENFTRVETFGNPDVHWLRVTVDWRDPNVFTFRQGIVESNRVRH